MFKRLLGRKQSSNKAVVDRLYDQIVAAARQPTFYRDWFVPDTPLGRFEMLALHTFLAVDRIKDEPGAARELAQELTDHFFGDVENSLRELGIGDLGVPKRMKKLARMFYGRVSSYSDALGRGDAPALAEALLRNVRPGHNQVDAAAQALASYVTRVQADLRMQDRERLMQGRVFFPAADKAETAA